MNAKQKLSLACLTLFCAGAQAVELVADERLVRVFSTDGNSEARPDPAFSAFSATGQNSSVSATQFNASGSGFGFSDFDFFVRESFFDITFSTVPGEMITLTGTAFGDPGSFGFAQVRFRLFSGPDIDDAQAVYSDTFVAEGFDEGEFDFSATLDPGVYRLVAQTDITPGGFETFADFTLSAAFSIDPQADLDNDGVPNTNDNCEIVANPSQFDADNDGYGNACDADFNNDCAINVEDLGILRANFFSADPVTDVTEDGVVNVSDLGLLRVFFFQLPGPSGVVNTCDPQ